MNKTQYGILENKPKGLLVSCPLCGTTVFAPASTIRGKGKGKRCPTCNALHKTNGYTYPAPKKGKRGPKPQDPNNPIVPGNITQVAFPLPVTPEQEDMLARFRQVKGRDKYEVLERGLS